MAVTLTVSDLRNGRSHSAKGAALFALIGFLCGRPAAAQVATRLTIDPVHSGDCQVAVLIETARSRDRVGLAVDLTNYAEKAVDAGQSRVVFFLRAPLRQGVLTVATLNGEDATAAAVEPGVSPEPATTTGICPPDPGVPIFASAFIGAVIDTLAVDPAGTYVNADDAGSQNIRLTAGVAMDYRVIGSSASPVQLWLNAQTAHSVRTADVACASFGAETVPAPCLQSPTVSTARYVLHNASSVEAWIAPRLEFLTIGRNSATPSNLYVTARYGFIAVYGSRDIVKSATVASGLVATGGALAGSYLEVGWGKNELFADSWSRFKVDGLLSTSLIKRTSSRAFVEILVDTDTRGGSDAVRSIFGLQIDVSQLFRGER